MKLSKTMLAQCTPSGLLVTGKICHVHLDKRPKQLPIFFCGMSYDNKKENGDDRGDCVYGVLKSVKKIDGKLVGTVDHFPDDFSEKFVGAREDIRQMIKIADEMCNKVNKLVADTFKGRSSKNIVTRTYYENIIQVYEKAWINIMEQVILLNQGVISADTKVKNTPHEKTIPITGCSFDAVVKWLDNGHYAVIRNLPPSVQFPARLLLYPDPEHKIVPFYAMVRSVIPSQEAGLVDVIVCRGTGPGSALFTHPPRIANCEHCVKLWEEFPRKKLGDLEAENDQLLLAKMEGNNQ
ncbi:MAG: hypothetical protein WCF94_04110 [bacterium]